MAGNTNIGGGGPTFARVATTTNTGFTLQNATPNILSWTAPNDGKLHSAFIAFRLNVSVLQVGGAVGSTLSATGAGQALAAGGLAAGDYLQTTDVVVVHPGETFNLNQTSAQTGGASVAYAEIWAN